MLDAEYYAECAALTAKLDPFWVDPATGTSTWGASAEETVNAPLVPHLLAPDTFAQDVLNMEKILAPSPPDSDSD